MLNNIQLVLIHEGLLISDATTRQNLEYDVVLLDRRFQHLKSHIRRKNRQKEDRSDKNDYKYHPHEALHLYYAIILARKIVKTEVDDSDLH